MNPTKEAKQVVSILKNRKKFGDGSFFVVEGDKLVKEGLDSLEFVLYSQNLDVLPYLAEKGIKALKISNQEMSKITSLETPPGIIGVARLKVEPSSSALGKKKGFFVIAQEIQDPGNLGTIIRCLDAVGGSGLFVSKGTVDPYNPKEVRGSMGGVFRIPVFEFPSHIELFDMMKKNGINIVAASLGNSENLWDVDFGEKTAIVIGNESAGISEDILSLCDKRVRIPMPGRAESLNAGMAASVILYEVLRRRNG